MEIMRETKSRVRVMGRTVEFFGFLDGEGSKAKVSTKPSVIYYYDGEFGKGDGEGKVGGVG